MREPKVWIVEMWHPYRERWEPTVGCSLTLSDARAVRAEWQGRNPDDRFKVTAYQRRPA